MDIMHTDRLVLREFTYGDIDKLFALLCNPQIMKYCSGPLNIDDTQKWLVMIIAAYKKYGYDYWAVYEKNTDDFIGQIGILKQDIDGRQLDSLAFMIEQKQWNKGYATEGAMACINYAFETLKIQRLIATVEPENIESISVLKKIGMEYDGETNYGNKKVFVYVIRKR